ncbi:MAG TPA: type II toxin-antitoxin system VapC family toxin [Caulobacteraceae bacterium]
MIFVDASAIVAIIADEPEADDLRQRLDIARERTTSAIAVYEATLALARIGSVPTSRAKQFVTRFLTEAKIEHVQIGEREAILALEAFDRFGKGRHPARLNMGDCFAYACVRAHGATLLFKGSDFSQTDIEAA